MICCAYFRVDFFDWESRQFDSRPEWQDVDGMGGGIRKYARKTPRRWICSPGPGGSGCAFWKDSLCSLQKRLGVSAMPSVCRTYPRVITRLGDRVERSLDPCCPVSVNLTRDWRIGELSIEGDGPLPSDEEYLRRERAFSALSDTSVPFDAVLRKLSDEYSCAAEIPALPDLSGEHDIFLRKATALLVLSDILPYEGYPTVPNVMTFIIDFACSFVPVLSSSGTSDWWEMSLLFSRELVRKVISEGFDEDMEDRYIDILEDRR